MPKTVFVVSADADDRAWIESALAHVVDAVVFLDDGPGVLATMADSQGDCLVAFADEEGEDEARALRLVRELRAGGATVPVIVLGPHTAFRTAVNIARLEATDFLVRPVSPRQLRAALQRACQAAG
ncbi:hypothetical protein QTH97_15350 [Variovorax sp. J22R24]|uniref:hypothetical protein n=1 Tax=Variovorax gracilis TaxID=3053502 RepID=UPI0025786230|nr:hypothetical protein [Variovorax sp. J22R24]MDM0106322.1 hypothetical protein [Variovorax sp. J22R24]